MPYRRRILDELLDEVLPDLAAIALEGAKGVGKTATASQRAQTVLNLADPAVREVIATDFGHVGDAPRPVLIDEWQLVPSVWDSVRGCVDDDPSGGRFLLTGSAGVAPGVRIHSGAGRIVSLHMRPLAMAERGVADPVVSLREMLQARAPRVTGRNSPRLAGYVDEILRSGFPGIRDLPDRARNLQLDSYLRRMVDRELPENGMSVRRPESLREWVVAYGAATATDAAYSTILDAATPGVSDKPTRQTAAAYRDHLTRIFVLDPVPAWLPASSPLKRLTQSPKHHLVDAALAARLVGVGRDGLLHGDGRRVGSATGSWLGALFESLVTQSVRVYAEACNARLGHLRTRDTLHEIDLIVEGEDRSVVAIEVKLSATVGDRDVRHLNWLYGQLGDRLVERVVINTGEFAYRRPDGVAVVPLALLGP